MAVNLTDISVFYSQDSIAAAGEGGGYFGNDTMTIMEVTVGAGKKKAKGK